MARDADWATVSGDIDKWTSFLAADATKGSTAVRVHGVGPFIVNHVNPADDPSKR